MSDVKVNSVDPATIGPDMVAYLLTVSILSGGDYNKGHYSSDGLPLINGASADEILKTYAKSRMVVARYFEAEKFI